MGNSQSRGWQEQHIPAHLINNPEAITFLAITLQDERSTRITGPTAPVPICGIPHVELSSSWPEAARQLQVAFCRENPPIHVFFQHKRIKVAKWAIKKPRLAGHTAFVYFDERTPYDSQVLDTSMLYSVPFEVTVTIIFSPFDTVVFPTLTLQVLPASSVEALRALIGRWIEMEVKHARGTDVLVGESALALHMVQNPLGTPRRAGGGRRRAASTPAQLVSADGVEFELVTRRGGGSVARVSGGAGRFGAEGGPVLLPQRGKVGEWTGWAMCVVIFEAGISLV